MQRKYRSMVSQGQNLAPGSSQGHGRYLRSLRRGCGLGGSLCTTALVLAASRATNTLHGGGSNSWFAYKRQLFVQCLTKLRCFDCFFSQFILRSHSYCQSLAPCLQWYNGLISLDGCSRLTFTFYFRHG